MRKSAPRLEYIDTLRGIACLWVVMCHVNSTWAVGNLKEPAWSGAMFASLLAKAGWMGVFLFLVLSGFCLYYPLVRKDNYKVDLREFAYRRCRRILPPYYAAMLFCVVISVLTHHGIPKANHLVSHALMIHNLHPATVNSINSDFWSLGLEFHLYIVFPLIVLAMTKWGTKRVLIGAVLISAIYQLLVWKFLLAAAMPHFAESLQPAVGRVLYRSVIGGLSCFVAGMAAARLVIHPLPNQGKWAALVCVLMTPYCVWGYLIQGDQEGGAVPVHHVALGLFFAAMIVIIAGHEARKAASEAPVPLLRRVTTPIWTFITWVGGFSYSLYLIHHPILKLMKPYALAHNFTRVEALLVFLVTGLPIIVAISYAFFLVAEKPFIGAKRQRQLAHQEPAEVPPLEPQPAEAQPVTAVAANSSAG